MGYVEELDRLRQAFLVTVFEATNGSPDESVAQGQVEAKLGITHERAEDVFGYLWNQGLVEPKYMGGQIGITHAGRLAVEAALREASQGSPVGFRADGP